VAPAFERNSTKTWTAADLSQEAGAALNSVQCATWLAETLRLREVRTYAPIAPSSGDGRWVSHPLPASFRIVSH
jgi:hypothetical protein